MNNKHILSCTNEDLKRLKEELKRPREVHHLDSWAPEIEALLARLEAAEKVADLMYSMPPINPDDGSNKIIANALEAWRKAAGK